MRRILVPLFSLALLSATALALDPGKFAPVSKRLQEYVDQKAISGAVGLMAKGDATIVASVGYRDLASKTPIANDDLFWIASMTKPMAAVCVAMLVDEGKMSFDDPVEKHLPEFRGQWLIEEDSKERRVLKRPERPITIRDLMTHTSGLGNVPSPRPNASLAELCMAYAREPLMFPIGSKWSYSNSGINTLGRLVEVGSGQSFGDFIQARLFDPLGMKDTTFWPTPEQAQRLAKSYKLNEGKLEEVDIFFLQGPLSERSRTAYPAGGLFSTARDVAKFYRMMLSHGTLDGRAYLKSQTVAEMTKTQTGDIKTGFVEGMSWGLGFQVVKEPKDATAALSAGTFGHGGAYGTQSWADPATGAIYILMIQRAGLPNGDAFDMRRDFQDLARAALQ